MTPPGRRFGWSSVDPLLAGPRTPRPAPEAVPFQAPGSVPGGYRFGRLEAGAAWPTSVAAPERLAAVPAWLPPAAGPPPGSRDVVLALRGPDRARFPICWTAGSGEVHWRFDPVAWIRGLLSEAYVDGWTRPLPSRLPLGNYSRLPHWTKGLLEGLQSPRAAGPEKPTPFPLLPLDDLVESIRSLCAALAFPDAKPSGSPWPGGRGAAVTLTHDVDTAWILEDARGPLLREILREETALGYRGAWYVTASRLRPGRHRRALEAIAEAGHEIGIHGWNHDAKLDFLSEGRQRARLERARRRAAGLDVGGIRTPWYARSPRLLRVLSGYFDYGSSVPNASGFFSRGSNSGCCSVYPFRHVDGLLELPMTVPPDTSLPAVGRRDAILRISNRIVALGGVVVLTLHPQPHQSAREPALSDFLETLQAIQARHGDGLWQATPRDVAVGYAARLADAHTGQAAPGAGPARQGEGEGGASAEPGA